MTEAPKPSHGNELVALKRADPLVVEQEGRRLAVVAFSDLDGTANDETIPEKDRIFTIGPARETLQAFEQKGIVSGVNTGRSFGEAQFYMKKLGVGGPVICEDGAVVMLPSSVDSPDAARIGGISHDGEWAVVLSKSTRSTVADIVQKSEKELGVSLVNTVTSSAEDIKEVVGHPTVEAAAFSADRLASGFIVATPEQSEIISGIANTYDMRTFGVPLHVIGRDAHKGHALKFINEHADVFFPGMNVQGILPIAFGNNVNDLAFMETCREVNNGIGVLVGKPGGGYFVDEEKIPDFVIRTQAPYGHGMKEAVPQILAQLNNRFQLDLK